MDRKILFALLLMGFTSLVVQTLLIREFLISFYGSELTIGIILSNWIILEALGSSLLSGATLKVKRPRLIYSLLQLGIVIYLPISIFLIRTIKNILGLTLGEGIGILPVFFGSLFILAPLSLFDGAQFSFGCRILSDASGRPLESTGRVYILEAMGFILAGPIFTYLLITKLNSFSIAFVIGLLNLLSALLLLKIGERDILIRSFSLIIQTLSILVILSFLGPAKELHKISINKQWKGQEILDYQNSIYGNIAVTKSANQYTFYSDGIPIITTPLPDITSIEERVHFSMLSHPNPKDVLLLSGGAGGVIKEILKYPIKKLTYAELDPLLIKLVKNFPTELTHQELSDDRLEIKHMDARRFLRLSKSKPRPFYSDKMLETEKEQGKYDIVILNLPMPSTLQLNRFYTQEFFQNIKSLLNKEGIFSLSLPGSLSYINPQMRNLNGSILNTLKSIFYVNVIPGEVNLYLASLNKFNINPPVFLKGLEEKGIQTKLLNSSYFEYRLHQRWLDWFYHSLSDYTLIRKNSDLLPSGTFYSISYWNSIFSPRFEGFFKTLDRLKFKVLLLSLLGVGVGLSLGMRFIPKLKGLSIGFAVATTGFTGMSLDLIFIYTYQAFYGFVFSHLALLVTAFMFGLTWGGWRVTKRLSKIRNDFLYFSKIEGIIIVFCLLVGPLLSYIGRFLGLNLCFIFFISSAISGYLVGSEFPLANKIYSQNKSYTKTSGILYALDLGGAWVAALVVSIALVPVIGILNTCLLLAVLKIISLISVILSRD